MLCSRATLIYDPYHSLSLPLITGASISLTSPLSISSLSSLSQSPSSHLQSPSSHHPPLTTPTTLRSTSPYHSRFSALRYPLCFFSPLSAPPLITAHRSSVAVSKDLPEGLQGSPGKEAGATHDRQEAHVEVQQVSAQ